MFDLDATTRITLYGSLWAVLLVLALLRNSRSSYGSVGLPFAFLAIYSLVHGGALVHLIKDYDYTRSVYLLSLSYSRDTVADGLEASWLGMLGATIGFYIAEVASRSRLIEHSAIPPLRLIRRGSYLLIIIGWVIFVLQVVFTSKGFDLGGFQGIMSNGRNLVSVGACGLVLCAYLLGKTRRAAIIAVVFVLLMPAAALVTSGLLSDSITLAFALLGFYLTLRPRGRSTLIRDIAIVVIVTVSSIIFSAGYMQSRTVLREAISRGVGVVDAISIVVESAGNFDIGSTLESETLVLLDSRLNQNIFIGRAIEKLRSLPDTYERGDTILLALFGWVPRFLWPNKPERGGSEFIAKHTGKYTAGETTFGAGPVFEFYVNFGYTGVFIGFIALGVVLRVVDVFAIANLRAGRVDRFAQYYLLGLPILQPLADLFFIVAAMAAALLLGWSLRIAWERQFPFTLGR